MTNLDTKIEALRDKLQEKFRRGDKEGALTISRQLDMLLVLAQREQGSGETVIYTDKPSRNGKLCR